MKIIQSFWGGHNKDIENPYGWANYRFHWLGWMLSSLQLRSHYEKVELYTDKFGYDLLVKKLRLPYTDVHVVLDELDTMPNGLWAMAKIESYGLQTEPFLHIDGDVFIFDYLPQELLTCGIITQNKEYATEYYMDRWKKISPILQYIPKLMNNFHKGINNVAYNMGIIGGNDIDFFKGYSRASKEFVYNNYDVWDKLDTLNFNVFFEQVLLYAYAERESKNINVLIKEEFCDNQYYGFDDFDSIPIGKKYLHLLGNFKQRNFVCSKLLQYCWYNFPKMIERLFQAICPNDLNSFKYDFTLGGNQKLINWYKNNIPRNHNTRIALLARDLHNYEQVRLFYNLEANKQDYRITLLPEIILGQTRDGKFNLSIREIFDNSYISELGIIDELIINELRQPKLKSELFENIKKKLNTKLSSSQEITFYKTGTNIIKQLLCSKAIAIEP
ncbi:DUF6734 family protein [Hoylesella timonensis]|uniref:DUF6734 family protein n=1 Tax=Hoylesella timonensis TaxID=386414 RepID=UPI00189B6B50|nr:DUF6734 family protein [Hoylesella timonensis]